MDSVVNIIQYGLVVLAAVAAGFLLFGLVYKYNYKRRHLHPYEPPRSGTHIWVRSTSEEHPAERRKVSAE